MESNASQDTSPHLPILTRWLNLAEDKKCWDRP